MKSISLQVRIPESLRKEADEVLADVGLDMSTAMRIYLRKIVSTRSIPFPLTAEPTEKLEYVPVDSQIQNKLDKVDKLWKNIKK